MPNLSIKDVPENIAEALRQRAERNHRSLQGELMAIIQQAVQESSAGGLPANWNASDGRRGTRTIEQLIEARRGKYPEPIRGVPLAVDIIRADRDSR
ncbi:Arc family DNA-binding protein [Ramlibacter ginsenosidimutans]|uniref:Arc family DNA-binding protein n=1 Tax=Ramlibacter ginsenosidimutans TaxID=502333 RepID=A0A934TQL1_9BURK|nr:Arc family DNA-binding protein [Ramlibacter ginsenosidimutans]MBK6005633.1 Arc family DNA-binding protein [Ramlibacter ginsenosidimutans]